VPCIPESQLVLTGPVMLQATGHVGPPVAAHVPKHEFPVHAPEHPAPGPVPVHVSPGPGVKAGTGPVRRSRPKVVGAHEAGKEGHVHSSHVKSFRHF
jgi:hypothetical protein